MVARCLEHDSILYVYMMEVVFGQRSRFEAWRPHSINQSKHINSLLEVIDDQQKQSLLFSSFYERNRERSESTKTSSSSSTKPLHLQLLHHHLLLLDCTYTILLRRCFPSSTHMLHQVNCNAATDREINKHDMYMYYLLFAQLVLFFFCELFLASRLVSVF